MTHTPGPWAVGKNAHFVHARNGISVAYLDVCQEQHLNAALIAAAPELLQMVRRFLVIANLQNESPGRVALAVQTMACELQTVVNKALGTPEE